MRALVFANGELDPDDVVPEADVVVCADGGTRHAVAFGLCPHVVIGDLDSLPPGLRDDLGAQGTRFLTYPRSKDETDLELALLHAAAQGATEIVVLGARGGRLDHELGNLLLLAHPRLRAVDVRLRTGRQEALLVRREITLQGNPGDLLSLVPIGGDALGVTTDGLQYPLADEPLRFGRARGISNVFLTGQARVWVRDGLLLAVHTRCTGREQSGG